ncbi:MAG: DUF3592 domain-containing protein [Clostridiales bacterium]|nr:DUF3592 domain-containing protein [Clostridiales bacterium]
MPNSLWIKGIVCIFLGLAADIAGLILKIYGERQRPYDGYTEAKVVDIIPIERERYAEARFRNRQAAVFEFFSDGKLIKLIDKEDIYPCPYQLGQRIRICYDRNDPEKYIVIRNDKPRWRATALNILGMVLVLAGVLMFLMYAQRYHL